MEAIFGAIHGTYAYLLIFQIVVVTMLFLTLLWLVVRRTRDGLVYSAGVDRSDAREDAASASNFALGGNAAAAYAANSPNAPAGQPGADASGAGVSSGADTEKLRKLEEEKNGLAEKVKFLESKLLEYEILQEEIGALGALKQENEKLKQRLVSLDAGGKIPVEEEAPAAPPAIPDTAPTAAALSDNEHNPKELAQQLASAFDTGVVFTEPESTPAPAPAAKASAPDADADKAMPPAKKQPDLDELLSQIDSLTSKN